MLFISNQIVLAIECLFYLLLDINCPINIQHKNNMKKAVSECGLNFFCNILYLSFFLAQFLCAFFFLEAQKISK